VGPITRARAKELKTGFVTLARAVTDDLDTQLARHVKGSEEKDKASSLLEVWSSKEPNEVDQTGPTRFL